MTVSRRSHSERIQEAFSQQAPSFEDPSLNQAFTAGLERLVAAVAPDSTESCLDVAAGTGHVSRALAPHVRSVVALDAVEEMLKEGLRRAEEAGLSNIVFQLGDATDLPFEDGTFDAAVTRLSLHHLSEPKAAVAELVRVCRPGGRVVIADLIRDPAAFPPDEMERLRDPSHLRVLTLEQIGSALFDAGAVIAKEGIERRERQLEPWLEQAGTPTGPAEEIQARVRAELRGGRPTGLEPFVRDGVTYFTQRWATVTARLQPRAGQIEQSTPGMRSREEDL